MVVFTIILTFLVKITDTRLSFIIQQNSDENEKTFTFKLNSSKFKIIFQDILFKSVKIISEKSPYIKNFKVFIKILDNLTV